MAECTIYDKLRYIAETKDLIKAAIESQDVEVLESDAFKKYAQYITEIRKVSSVNGLQGDVTLKTINGVELTGSGDIIIQGDGGSIDLSDYYTREEIDKILTEDYVTLDYIIEKGFVVDYQLDEYAKKTDIPTSNTQLTNDAKYITLEEVPKTDLSNYATLDDIPSLNGYATEQWVKYQKYLTEVPSEYITETELNNKGYLTEHQSLEEYAKKTDIPTIPSSNTAFTNDAGYITLSEVPQTDLSNYYNKEQVNELIDNVSAGDVDLTNYYTKSEVYNKEEVNDLIPDVSEFATQEWVGNQGYLTEHQSLEDYAKKSDIPDVSEFIKEIPSEYVTESELNGKGYLTSIPDTYVTDEELSTAVSDKVSQNALNEAIQGVDGKIPTQYVKRLGIKDNNLVYKDENDTVTGFATLKTINGESIIGGGNITIEGGGEPEQYVKNVTTDNIGSIYINNNDGSSDRIVFPLINGQQILGNGGNIVIEGGGTAGVEAINIGTSVQDWTLKTGIVSLYTQMYDGGYEVSADGMSFFGIKPADDTIIIEQGGGTANGCFRGTIRVNPDVLGGGSGNAPTLQEGVSGTTSNYIYSDGDQNSDNCVLASASLGTSYNTNNVSVNLGVKLWGDTSYSSKDSTTIIGATTERAGVMTAEDKQKLETLCSNSGNTGGGSSVNVIELTQSEYDALGSYEQDAIYVITDSNELKFKTINGESILGDGNITIEGGSGGSSAGVSKIILGEEDYGWNAYDGNINLLTSLFDLGSDGVFYDVRVGNNNGNSVWFGFTSSNQSLKIGEYSSRINLIVNEWVGTQEEYDALGEYDNNCTYYII